MLSVFLLVASERLDSSQICPIKYLMVAGEAFPKSLVEKSLGIFGESSVENIYGPTEAA